MKSYCLIGLMVFLVGCGDDDPATDDTSNASDTAGSSAGSTSASTAGTAGTGTSTTSGSSSATTSASDTSSGTGMVAGCDDPCGANTECVPTHYCDGDSACLRQGTDSCDETTNLRCPDPSEVCLDSAFDDAPGICLTQAEVDALCTGPDICWQQCPMG